MRLCFAVALVLVGAVIAGSQFVRSPYQSHPHFVWGLTPSFFERHNVHSDEEVIENAVGILIGIGDYCWHEGFHFQLIRILKASVELEPTFGEAYENAAWLLISYNRKDEALQILKQYLQRNPNRYEPYYELGWFYFHWQKEPNKAIPWLEKANRFPHPPIIEHTLAHAYERAGRLKEALAVWENKLKRYPNDPVANRQSKRLREILKKLQE